MNKNAIHEDDSLYLDRARAANIVTNLFTIVALLQIANPQNAPVVLVMLVASVLIIVISLTKHVTAIWISILPSAILFTMLVPLYINELPTFDALVRLLIIYAAYVAVMFFLNKILP